MHDYPQHGLRRVTIQDIEAAETVLASSITGIPGDAVEEIALSGLRIENVLRAQPDASAAAVPEKPSAYPEARMFGMLPTSGFYVRHARNLHMKDVDIRANSGESRPTLVFDDVDGVHITGMKSTPVSGSMPVVSLIDARNVEIADSAAPAGTETFVGVNGSDSANIVLAGDDLHGARRAFEAGSDVPQSAVTIVGHAAAPSRIRSGLVQD